MKRELQLGLLLGLAGSLWAQAAYTTLPAQPLEREDLVSITVANLPEMSRPFRVDSNGLRATSQTTILDAIARAEGFSPGAGPILFVSRPKRDSDDPELVSVPIKLSILKGKTPDYRLDAHDVLYIPKSRGRRLTAQMMNALIGIGVLTASGAIVF